MNKILLLAVFTIAAILTAGCGSLKPGSSGKSSKHFETFYAGSEGGTQYFIKPMVFGGPEKQGFVVDFTLRDIDFAADQTTVNYTLATNKQLTTNQAVTAMDEQGNTLFSTTKVERLFQERTKNGFLARFTAKAPNIEVANAFKIGTFSFLVTLEDGSKIEFEPENSTENSIPEIYRYLFSLY